MRMNTLKWRRRTQVCPQGLNDWNCRGISHPSTMRSLRGYVKSQKPSYVFVSKVKCCNSVQIEKIVRSLKFNFFEFVPAIGKSGGLLLMWRQDLNIKVIVSSSSFINCMVFCNHSPTSWQLTCIYGPPIPTHKQQFWNSLDNIGNSLKGPWLVIEDFNSILSSVEKLRGKAIASFSNGGLRRIMDDHGLIDLGFEGHAYT